MELARTFWRLHQRFKSTVENQGHIFLISLLQHRFFNKKSVACSNSEMARNLHSRKLASLIVLLAFWFLISELNVNWIKQILGTFLIPLLTARNYKMVQSATSELSTKIVEKDERAEMMTLISEHCLPKLVCELYAKDPSSGVLADSEKSLMALIGSSSLSSLNPTKYHHASYIGQLIMGLEGQGCHHFYPMCPFSGEDVQQIARKVILK